MFHRKWVTFTVQKETEWDYIYGDHYFHEKKKRTRNET